MLCSFELPEKRPEIDEGVRHGMIMVLLVVIIALAIYFALEFADVAMMVLEEAMY